MTFPARSWSWLFREGPPYSILFCYLLSVYYIRPRCFTWRKGRSFGFFPTLDAPHLLISWPPLFSFSHELSVNQNLTKRLLFSRRKKKETPFTEEGETPLPLNVTLLWTGAYFILQTVICKQRIASDISVCLTFFILMFLFTWKSFENVMSEAGYWDDHTWNALFIKW